jgi:hypothetical protein
MTNDNNNDAIESARAWADEIAEWFKTSNDWRDASRSERETLVDPDDDKPEPLSVLIRSDWHTPGTPSDKAIEYEILLSTGGPAVRLTGSLNQYGEASSVMLQCQNWFTNWTGVACDDDTSEALQAYVATFYFGE